MKNQADVESMHVTVAVESKPADVVHVSDTLTTTRKITVICRLEYILKPYFFHGSPKLTYLSLHPIIQLRSSQFLAVQLLSSNTLTRQ